MSFEEDAPKHDQELEDLREERRAPMSALSGDTLAIILSFLAPDDLLLRAKGVCREFRAQVTTNPAAWPTHFEMPYALRDLRGVVPRRLRCTSLRCIRQGHPGRYLGWFRNLRRLFVGPGLDDRKIQCIVRMCPFLEDASFSQSWLSQDGLSRLSALPLTNLILCYNQGDTETLTPLPIRPMPLMRELLLRFTYAGATGFVQNCPVLRSLVLHSPDTDAADRLKYSLRSLECLDIEVGPGQAERLLQEGSFPCLRKLVFRAGVIHTSFIQRHTGLRSLELCHVSEEAPALELETMLQTLVCLEELELGYIANESQQVAVARNVPPTLKKLYVRFYAPSNDPRKARKDAFLELLLPRCTRLEDLSLPVTRMGSYSFHLISLHSPALVSLLFHSPDSLSGLLFLPPSCPKLQTVRICFMPENGTLPDIPGFRADLTFNGAVFTAEK